jgi:hypothetical protein
MPRIKDKKKLSIVDSLGNVVTTVQLPDDVVFLPEKGLVTLSDYVTSSDLKRLEYAGVQDGTIRYTLR